MPPRTQIPRTSSSMDDTFNKSTGNRHRSSVLQNWELTAEYHARKVKLEWITKDRTSFIAKPAQIRVALALDHGHDILCIAATGFGKSLAFQMAVFLLQERNLTRKLKQFGVCITPIEALGEDQVTKCLRYGVNAVCLTDKAIQQQPNLVQEVIKGEYDLGIFASSVLYSR